MSIKDRWVGPREQVLNVLIACWWHDPSKPRSSSSTEAWRKITVSLVGLGEKLGIDLWIGRPACWGLCREPFFSGAVGSVQIYRWLAKGCYALSTWDTYGLGPYAEWAWDACGMLVGFSPSRCTSIRIAMTLGWVPLICDNHHVDNLTNLMSLSVIDLCCLLHLIDCNSCLSRM
jgi:hypothetical protein